MNRVLGHLCAYIDQIGPREPLEDGEMNEMTLSSRGPLRYFSVMEAPHKIHTLLECQRSMLSIQYCGSLRNRMVAWLASDSHLASLTNNIYLSTDPTTLNFDHAAHAGAPIYNECSANNDNRK